MSYTNYYTRMIKVHIGCGNRNFGEDWYHIDGSDYPHIKSHDIVNLPFENDSIDIIYASHVFEYFDREHGLEVIKYWRKYLKLGGILRLAVPNFKSYAKLYVDEVITLDQIIGPLYGKWNISPEKTVYHKTVYDEKSLYEILENGEMRNIETWDWWSVEHSMYDDYSQAYIPHMDKKDGTLMSLNIQCIK